MDCSFFLMFEYEIMNCRIISPFNKQRCIWLDWPNDNNIWRNDCIPVQKEFAAICMATSMSAPVFVSVPNCDLERAGFIIPHHINLVPIDGDYHLNDSIGFWGVDVNRHLSALFLRNSKHSLELKLMDKYKAEIAVPSLNIPSSGFVADYCGIFMGFKQNWENANPSLSLTEIENALGTNFGKMEFIWIDSEEIITPKINSICSFTNTKQLLLNWNDQDPEISKLAEEIFDCLNNYRLASGEYYQVHKIPAVDNVELLNQLLFTKKEGYIHPSYTSVLPLNERLIVPLYGTLLDNDVLFLMSNLFKSHDVAGVEVAEIAKGGVMWNSLALAIPA